VFEGAGRLVCDLHHLVDALDLAGDVLALTDKVLAA
jgi:hypothetical protein